jgi:quercetin dioxygenase-like cupin family protein
MSELGSFVALAAEEPFAGVSKRSFDSAGATVSEYRFEPGATFPLHRHEQEQITIVESGELRMTIGGEEHALAAGGWSVVAGGVEHGITAGASGARFFAVVVPRRGASDEFEVSGDE